MRDACDAACVNRTIVLTRRIRSIMSFVPIETRTIDRSIVFEDLRVRRLKTSNGKQEYSGSSEASAFVIARQFRIWLGVKKKKKKMGKEKRKFNVLTSSSLRPSPFPRLASFSVFEFNNDTFLFGNFVAN